MLEIIEIDGIEYVKLSAYEYNSEYYQKKVQEYEALLVDIEAIALNRVDCCGGLDDIREMVKNKLNE